jgi:hypothetical protein
MGYTARQAIEDCEKLWLELSTNSKLYDESREAWEYKMLAMENLGMNVYDFTIRYYCPYCRYTLPETVKLFRVELYCMKCPIVKKFKVSCLKTDYLKYERNPGIEMAAAFYKNIIHPITLVFNNNPEVFNE